MERLKGFLAVCLIRALALLPLAWLRAGGRALARLLWRMNIEARKVTEENLRLCFPELPEAERERLARASMEHLCVSIFEISAVWCRPLAQVERLVGSVHGKPLLDRARSAGKGVVILSPHLGNWEVLGLYLARQGPLTNLYQPIRWPQLDRLVRRARSRGNARVTPTTAAGIKTLLKTLKRGEMVGVLPDQTPPLDNGVFAPFFGVPALTMTLAPNLLRRTGAAAVVATAWRNSESGLFDIYFSEVDAAIDAADPAQAASALNRSVETLVRRFPEQYQWEYKRFRRQPGGARPYYRYNR